MQLSPLPNSRTRPSPQEESLLLLAMVPSSSLALANNTLLSVSVALSFWTLHWNGIIQYGAFCIRLLLLRTMFYMFIRVVACMWVCNPPGSFLAVIWNWPLYREGRRDLRKWQATPGWQVTVFITAKGADRWALSWAAAIGLDPCTCSPNPQSL